MTLKTQVKNSWKENDIYIHNGNPFKFLYATPKYGHFSYSYESPDAEPNEDGGMGILTRFISVPLKMMLRYKGIEPVVA